VYGQHRRVVLTHSQNLHQDQAQSFTDTTLAKVGRQLDDLAATLARGKPAAPARNSPPKSTRSPTTPGSTPSSTGGELRAPRRPQIDLDNQRDETTSIGNNVFGKRILITDHTEWPVADIVAGYRSQSEIEFGFRQLKDPHEVSFSPMHHWTDHNIAVHTFTCVLALQLAHLMRLTARRAGHDLSVKAILDTLGGIQETVLMYPSTGGRPKARRITTDMNTDQQALHDLYNLHRWAPPPAS
jgi:hypothetical protein